MLYTKRDQDNKEANKKLCKTIQMPHFVLLSVI